MMTTPRMTLLTTTTMYSFMYVPCSQDGA
jgi:hypothetical protein